MPGLTDWLRTKNRSVLPVMRKHSAANTYTDTRESAINQRTDTLMATEQLARQNGDAATLNSAKATQTTGKRPSTSGQTA
jgi:prophage antirepressor-like protein